MNYENAFEQSVALAAEGDPQGQCNLGLLYANGLGVEQDYVQAAHWYLLAARQGDAQAQFGIGLLYQNLK